MSDFGSEVEYMMLFYQFGDTSVQIKECWDL